MLIHGKGNKQRLLGISDQVLAYIMEYINEVRGESPGPLIVKFNKDDDIVKSSIVDDTSYCLTPGTINDILCQRCKELPKEYYFNPHSLRGTYATEQIEDGIDIFTVSKSLGHSTVATTQHYDLSDQQKVVLATKTRKF